MTDWIEVGRICHKAFKEKLSDAEQDFIIAACEADPVTYTEVAQEAGRRARSRAVAVPKVSKPKAARKTSFEGFWVIYDTKRRSPYILVGWRTREIAEWHREDLLRPYERSSPWRARLIVSRLEIGHRWFSRVVSRKEK